ncbi:hypothetical protein [Streptomyces chattanoogensis]|uniref:hypothetical protein n=1 Tax=Streptomyces chattanoogensis TaxID=66876 RepID=UPI0036BD505B
MTTDTADAGVGLTPLLGDWLSTDGPTSSGFARLTVGGHGGSVRVRAFVGGDPAPRDWCDAPAVLHTTLGVARSALTAAFDLGFLRTVVSAHHKGGILVVTTSNVFRETDERTRADYWTREFFHRSHGRFAPSGLDGAGTGRADDRPKATRPVAALDVAPLVGSWINFDRATTGIVHAEVAELQGRLTVRLQEADGSDWGALPVIPLAADTAGGRAIGFRAEPELGPEHGSRQIYLCSYLNRGLLTIDVHAATPGDPSANVMYRAHFHRTEEQSAA